MNGIKEAYEKLVDAQASNDPEAATAAYHELGSLIRSLPEGESTPGLPQMPGLAGVFDDDENLTPEQRRDKVLTSLYDAAMSGNVPAILKWIEMNPVTSSSSESENGKSNGNGNGNGHRKRSRKPKPSKRLTVKEVRFCEHYFDCDECRGNATKAVAHAGFKGSTNVLAVTGFRLLRNPKIAEYVSARLETSAMSIEEVLRGMSEIASGAAKHFLNLDGDRPEVTLKKAAAAGKLHLVKSVKFHPNGAVKDIVWYDALQARIALARYHQMARPPMMGDEEPTAEEMARVALMRAREAVQIAMQVAKRSGTDLTFEEARDRAVKFFPAAKELSAKDFVNTDSTGVN